MNNSWTSNEQVYHLSWIKSCNLSIFLLVRIGGWPGVLDEIKAISAQLSWSWGWGWAWQLSFDVFWDICPIINEILIAFDHNSTANKCRKCFPLKSYSPIWTGKCFLKNLPLKKSVYLWQVCTLEKVIPLFEQCANYLRRCRQNIRILALADNLRIRCSNIQAQLCQTFYLGGQQLKSYLARIQTFSMLLNYFLDYRYKITIKI